ncbi:MAG: hypothetical protein ACC650_06930 [Gammaproteobacteria bacterium]
MYNIIGSGNAGDADVSRIPWWKFIALGVVFFLWLCTESPGHNWGGDFSHYLLHAVNLVEGRPYADIGYIQNAFSFVGPAVYPPVFPVVLAPVYFFLGLDWIALKAVVVIAFSLALYLVTSLQGNKLGKMHQLAIIIFLALNPYFWWLKDQILSDFLFLLTGLAMLSLLDKRYIKEKGGYRDIKNKNWGFAVPMGLLLYLSFATREIGIVFIPAVLFFELFHFKKISLVTCVALLIFLGLAGIQSVGLKAPAADSEMNGRIAELARDQGVDGENVSNSDYFNLNITNMGKQVVRYASEMRVLWPETENIFVKTASWIAFLLALLVTFAAYIRAVLSGPGMLEVFVAGYLAVLVLFSGFQGLRYLVPLIPIFLFYAFTFHHQLLHSRYRKIMIVIAAFFAGTTAISYASSYDVYLDRQNHGITSPDATAFFEYVKDSTPEASTFLFQKPRVLSLLTRRSASAWPHNRDPEFLPGYVNAIGADYLVYSNIDQYGQSHPVDSVPLPGNKFSLEYNNDSFYVYKLNTR